MVDLDGALARMQQRCNESLDHVQISRATALALIRQVRELRAEVASHRRLAGANVQTVLELAAKARHELGATDNTAVDPMSAYATLATVIEALIALAHVAAGGNHGTQEHDVGSPRREDPAGAAGGG